MRYSEKEKMLYFSKEELIQIYKKSKIFDLTQEMIRTGASFKDIQKDRSLMQEIADAVGDRGAEDRNEHEVFAALFSFSRFYPSDCEICFRMNRNFDPENSQILTLNDLNRYREEADISDFIINSSDGPRFFQLKRYRGVMDATSIFNFIQRKITHYANNIGDTNLLIQLQPVPYSSSHIDFHKIHENLLMLKLTFNGEVLISYNNNNKKHVLVQVYPGISKHEIPMELPSEHL